MRDSTLRRPFCRFGLPLHQYAAVSALLMALVIPWSVSRAEEETPAPADYAAQQVADPFGPVETDIDPFETVSSDSPVDAAAYVPTRSRWEMQQINFQGPLVPPQDPGATEELPKGAAVSAKDPCAAARFKPLGELGIGIAQPEGQSPTNFAGPCWEQINTGAITSRCWPVLTYQWDATCLCYQPLYFEEVNAERYGYICNDCCNCCCSPQDCLQSACSAAHFFGTVPCLPYCLIAQCPTECAYTLGHYRPATCGVPWRWNYPPCKPLAGAGAAGIYTGLIFAIP